MVWKRQNPNPSIPILGWNMFPFFMTKHQRVLASHLIDDCWPILLLCAEITVCSSLN